MRFVEPLEARRLCSGVSASALSSLPSATPASKSQPVQSAALKAAKAKPKKAVLDLDGSWTGSYRVLKSKLPPDVVVMIESQTPVSVGGQVVVGDQSMQFAAGGAPKGASFGFKTAGAGGLKVSVAGKVAKDAGSAAGKITLVVNKKTMTIQFTLVKSAA